MNNYKTIKEIANEYGVTTMAVRHWVKKYDINVKLERRIGKKPVIIINLDDIKKALEV